MNWSVENAAVLPNTAILPSAAKPKQTMLPLLVVLFLVSYGLLAMLVVEQGRTIDSQRNLIRELFSDSTQLSKMKGDATRKQRAEAQANAHPQAKAGPNVAPDKDADKQHHSGKVQKPAPQRPPRAASDDSDERRILISI